MARIIDIEGIGPRHAAALAAAGIKTSDALLNRAGNAAGRRALAEETKIDARLILEWVNRADLFRVKGVGTQYADLLVQAGVDSVKELGTRKPENLHARMLEVNAAKKAVHRPPTLTEVAVWVAEAKRLSGKRLSLVEYLLSAPRGEPEIPLDRATPSDVPA